MKQVFLVVFNDYEYSLNDSAWPSQEKAEVRLRELQLTPKGNRRKDAAKWDVEAVPYEPVPRGGTER